MRFELLTKFCAHLQKSKAKRIDKEFQRQAIDKGPKFQPSAIKN